MLLHARGARGRAPGGAGREARLGLLGHVPRRSRAKRASAVRRPASRSRCACACPTAATVFHDLLREPGRVRQRHHRRLHRPAQRRHRHLQPRRGGGRRHHGGHARHPRRRPHQQHAQAGASSTRRSGAPVPEFLHMPLLFGTDRKKLSKRHGATKLEQLTAQGYLVEVVRNYLCFLSTEFDETMITWTLDDLVERFDVLEPGHQRQHLRPREAALDERALHAAAGRRGARRAARGVPHAGRVLRRARPRSRSSPRTGPEALAAVVEGAEAAHALLVAPDERAGGAHAAARAAGAREDGTAGRLHPAGGLVLPAARDHRGGAASGSPARPARRTRCAPPRSRLEQLPEWTLEAVEALVRDLPARLEQKPKAVFAALRLGMSGQAVTPGLFESLWVLGRDEAAGRLVTAAAEL